MTSVDCGKIRYQAIDRQFTGDFTCCKGVAEAAGTPAHHDGCRNHGC